MKYTLFTIFLATAAFVCNARDISIRKKHFNLDNGLALSGYDAVTYLNQVIAIKGSKAFAEVMKGLLIISRQRLIWRNSKSRSLNMSQPMV